MGFPECVSGGQSMVQNDIVILKLFQNLVSLISPFIPSLEKEDQFRASEELVSADKWQRNVLIGVTQSVNPNQGGFSLSLS
jgi:hypothetical protein